MAEILLVDDDSDMTQVLTELLKSERWNVKAVSDGEQALQLLHHFIPSLIITDVLLPKMDGWQLCRKIKAHPDFQKIPVLVITAKADHISELMSYESGADAYISKPFDNEEFISMVQELLEIDR